MTRHRLDDEEVNLAAMIGRAEEIKETDIEYDAAENEVRVIYELKLDGEWQKYIEVYDRVGLEIEV